MWLSVLTNGLHKFSKALYSKTSHLTKEDDLLYWLCTANVAESKLLAIGKVETLTLLDQVR